MATKRMQKRLGKGWREVLFEQEHPVKTVDCGICGAKNTGRIGHDRCTACGHILDTNP